MSSDQHVEYEEIARLAEGRVSPEQAEPMLAHFSQCRSCMAAYTEAVRYRAAWLAKREAFEPPRDMLERGRAVLSGAPHHRPALPRRVFQVAAPVAAVLLVLVIIGRLGRQPTEAGQGLPPPVAQALAKRTLEGGLFVPGTEAVRVDAPDTLRSSPDLTVLVTKDLEDSLHAVYTQARAGRPRERAGFCFASALTARGSEREALEVVQRLLKDDPRNCACMSLAANLEYGRSQLDLAERHLSTALAAGCRDDVTQMNLGIVKLTRGDTAEARGIFERFEHRDDALGERARKELGRENP